MTCFNCKYMKIKSNNHYECVWFVASIIDPWEDCDIGQELERRERELYQ